MDLFRKKEINLNHTSEMKKELKTSDLIMLGIGAIIGTGIFVVTGVAANQNAGPALSFSFVLAAIVVILSGLSFAEFASRVPVIGGPYAYLYVVFGEFAAWLTGWLLIGEFLLAVSSVASGWSGYMQGFLKSLGAELPQALTGGYNPENGTYIDLIAVLVVIFVTYIVSLEAKKALRLNNAMVYVKFGIIALFIIVGIFFVKPDNWQPFMPFGFSGVLDGAALVLYIIVTLILTGIVPYTELGVNDPVAFAMRYVGHGTVGAVIAVGAILTLLTVTISMMYSLARLLFAVSKDGLLPKFMTEIDQKHRTPKKATYAAGVAAVFFAGFFPLNVLAELTNIMALAYLMLVSLGLLKLRKMFGKPKAGEFKVPFVPLLPIISILTCIVLMLRLQTVTWIVFGIVMVIGLIIYFGYGYGHSKMNEK